MLTSGGLGTMGCGFPAAIGAKGIRVTKPENIKTALISAKQNTKTPAVIEFIIDRELNVMPIVPPGNSLNDMIK